MFTARGSSLLHWLLIASVTSLFTVASPAWATPNGTHPTAEKRYKELARTINKNVGYAHLTRGVNACTILALRDQASEEDVPILAAMLRDKDHVVRLAALYVLSILGIHGIAALKANVQPPDAVDADSAIQEAAQMTASIDEYRKSKSCRIRH